MVIRPTAELPGDRAVLRTVIREADQNLGVYATVRSTGTANTGDGVEIA
jgi:hypothetical protein